MARRAKALRPGAASRGPHAQRQKIGADKAGVAVTERGFIDVNIQMRTNVPHILPLAISWASPCWRTRRHEGAWRPKSSPGIGGQQRTGRRCVQRPRDPQRGLHRPRSGLGGPDRRSPRRKASRSRRACSPGPPGPRHCQWATRALPSCCLTTRNPPHSGGGIVGTHAGDMIGEIALAIEMGRTA